MSTFERIYQTDPLRELDSNREIMSIELSDEKVLQRADYVRDMMKPAYIEPSETNHMMPESLEMADRITRKKDEKSKSKTSASKSKKDHPKRHKAAMESVQEKL